MGRFIDNGNIQYRLTSPFGKPLGRGFRSGLPRLARLSNPVNSEVAEPSHSVDTVTSDGVDQFKSTNLVAST